MSKFFLHKDFPIINFPKCLLICLTVSSRKDLSIAPCFIGGCSFHMQGLAEGEPYDDFWAGLIQIKTPAGNILVNLLLVWPVPAILSLWSLLRSLRKDERK